MPPAPAHYDTFIEGRIHYTRRQVSTVDIAVGLMVLGAGMLAFLLGVAVLDHWVVAGGLGFWGRLGLWLAGFAAAAAYCWRQVLPPLLHRINPVYAAQTIERSRPSLKNSLINFLLLRGHRDEVWPLVYQALQQRAAADLSQTNIEAAVDRGRVVRRAYLLGGASGRVCNLPGAVAQESAALRRPRALALVAHPRADPRDHRGHPAGRHRGVLRRVGRGVGDWCADCGRASRSRCGRHRR